jgi:hypothetical protein
MGLIRCYLHGYQGGIIVSPDLVRQSVVEHILSFFRATSKSPGIVQVNYEYGCEVTLPYRLSAVFAKRFSLTNGSVQMTEGGDPDWVKECTLMCSKCFERHYGKPFYSRWRGDLLDHLRNPLAPREFPAHISGLAKAISSSFPTVSDQYLILADALEELGEENAAAHCRKEIHSEGCSVLKWILGKV